jgi:hypothetical protein
MNIFKQKKDLPVVPKYIIVGAQKAGTTSLYEALSRHPELLPPRDKELHFFDDAKIPYPDWDSYWKCFPSTTSLRGRYTFEASPSYLFHPLAATRIAALNPRPHIIVILRDPVERAYSAWNMYRQMLGSNDPWEKSLGDSRSFDEALNEYLEGDRMIDWYRDPKDYFGRGLYAKQLARYLNHFRLGEDLHVFFFEELFSEGFERSFFKQIGLDDQHEVAFEKVHVRQKEKPMSPETRDRLEELYKKPNIELGEMLGRSTPWPK